MPVENKSVRVTACLDDETAALLARLAQQEFRSKSSTLALLIRAEAAKRGMIGRAPEAVPDVNRTQKV